jgi:hypothetical protein
MTAARVCVDVSGERRRQPRVGRRVGQRAAVADYVKNGELFPCPVYNNGAALTNAMVPQFESYFTNKADAGIFPKMREQSKTLLAKQK